ncbi:MAG TPA: hypothetical protein VF627_04025 [Abditibacterium sp.]|jgi:hypothetical protein
MADMTPQGTQDYAVESGYEAGDANVKAIVSGLSIILASTLVVMAAMFGMFNFLNRQANEAASKVPVALSQRIVPPEPRLLPEPYTDERAEAKALGASTPDVMPWDKRNLEIVRQYDEANSTARYRGETREAIRIPIARAIEVMSGKKGGSPAAMPWQPEYPRLMAGETQGKEGREMNLVPGRKIQESSTFDDRPNWETQDEKFTTDSSGGTILTPGRMSR